MTEERLRVSWTSRISLRKPKKKRRSLRRSRRQVASSCYSGTMQNSHSLELLLWFHASMEHLFLISCKGLRDNADTLWKFLENIHRQIVWRHGIQGGESSRDSSRFWPLCLSEILTPNVSRRDRRRPRNAGTRRDKKKKRGAGCSWDVLAFTIRKGSNEQDGWWNIIFKQIFRRMQGWSPWTHRFNIGIGTTNMSALTECPPSRQLEEENQRRVKEGKPSMTLEALGLTFNKHQWPHRITISIRGSFSTEFSVAMGMLIAHSCRKQSLSLRSSIVRPGSARLHFCLDRSGGLNQRQQLLHRKKSGWRRQWKQDCKSLFYILFFNDGS